MVRNKLKVRYKFLIPSLLLIIIAGTASYFLAGYKLESYILKSHINNLSNHINSKSKEHFNFYETFSLRAAGDTRIFAERLLKEGGFTNLTITDANGVILFSENKNLINSSIHTDHNFRAALTGESFTTNFNKEEESVTNYIPLFSENNNVRGVIYFDSYLTGIKETLRQFQLEIVLIVIIATTIFMLFAYFVMYELENQMKSQEKSITDTSKALAEEQKLYEAITTSLAESLIVINHDGQIILFNPEAEKLTGHLANEVEYRSYKKIINIYDEKGIKNTNDYVAEALKSGSLIKTKSSDNLYFKREEELIPVNINISPIKSEKSFVRGVAVTIENITAEKELQKIKDEFVYLVVHELGNPIFALDGYLSILEGELKKTDKRTKEIFDNAKGINAQLSTLVNDLLEVSRNETGRLEVELEEINLPEIFETVLENESFKADKEKVLLEIKKSKMPNVIGNLNKIKEVATNLVNNAIKYTPAGGRVEIFFENNGKEVSAHVKDSGIGLSPEEEKHLFEKFFRAKNKNTENISGTGLGLFISKQIVEKCGGKIWFKSQENKGSAFSFSLKIAKDSSRKVDKS